MEPETACSILMSYNTISGILFGIGLIIISIYILRNQKKDDDCWDDDWE